MMTHAITWRDLQNIVTDKKKKKKADTKGHKGVISFIGNVHKEKIQR